MMFKVSILLFSLACVAAVAVDPFVTEELEKTLEQMPRYREGASSPGMIIDRLRRWFKVQAEDGDYDNWFKMDSAIDLFDAASKEDTCRESISQLKEIYPAKGRISELIGLLEAECNRRE